MLITITRLAFAAALLLTAARAAPFEGLCGPSGFQFGTAVDCWDGAPSYRTLYGLGSHATILARWQDIQPMYPTTQFGFGFIRNVASEVSQYYGSTDEALLAIYPDIPFTFQNYVMTSHSWQDPHVITRLLAPAAPSSVPEPATYALFAGGVALLAFFRRQTASSAADAPNTTVLQNISERL